MERVVLNVGGIRYETTRSTLCAIPNTLLARIFAPENEHMLKRDEDGSVFFDRDGRLFDRVLDVYRTFTFSYPSDQDEQRRMVHEYEYWGLEDTSDQDEIKRVLHVRGELLAQANLPVHTCATPAFDLVAVGPTAHSLLAAMQVAKGFIENIKMVVTAQGIRFRALNMYDTCVISWSMPPRSFAKYQCTDDYRCHFIAQEFVDFLTPLLTSPNLQYAIRLCMNQQDITKLVIQVFQEAPQEAFALPLKLWPFNHDYNDFPDFTFDSVVQVDTHALRDVMMNQIAMRFSDSQRNYVTFSIVPSGLRIRFNSEFGEKEIPLTGRVIPWDDAPQQAKFGPFAWEEEKEDEEEGNTDVDTTTDANEITESPTKRRCLVDAAAAVTEEESAADVAVSVDITYLKSFMRYKMPYSTTTYIGLSNKSPLLLIQRIGEYGEGKLSTMVCSPLF